MANWPLVLYLALVLVVIGGMLGLSVLLGQRHREKETGTPYESGVHPTGGARLRVSVQFYRIAVFFVVFDLEAVFLFAWAIAGRELGWAGYVEVLVFVAVLVASLAYLWRLGALDWGPSPARARRAGTSRA